MRVSLLCEFITIFAAQETLHPNYAVLHSRFGDVQIVSNLTVTQATSHPAVNRAKNPDLFPKYLYNFTCQIMGLIGHAI